MTAKDYVLGNIKKDGFALSYRYFAYNIDWSKPLSKFDKECQKEFDNYYKENYGNIRIF